MPLPISDAAIREAMKDARQRYAAGEFAQAEAMYRQILVQRPDHAAAIAALGAIAIQAGKMAAGAGLIERAIALLPRSPAIAPLLNNLAIAHHALGRRDEAMTEVRQAIAMQPTFAEAHTTLGNFHNAAGRRDEARIAYQRAVQANPHYCEAYYNLGVMAQRDGDAEQAARYFARTIELMPGHAAAHSRLSATLQSLGRAEEALAEARKAADLAPNPITQYNLGICLERSRQWREAEAAYRRVIQLDKNHIMAHNNLGNVLHQLERYDEAAESIQKAVDLGPVDCMPYLNLGVVEQDRGRLVEAEAAYRQAIAFTADPRKGRRHLTAAEEHKSLVEAHTNLGIILLMSGRLREGWREYDWRLQKDELAPARRFFAQPPWDGLPLNGRTLVLHAEQGLGDTIQFSRYIPRVIERALTAGGGGRVIIACQAPACPLLKDFAGIDEVVDLAEAEQKLAGQIDMQLPLLCLPLLFDTTLDTIPADVPYLFADEAKSRAWQERLREWGSAMKVGLAWAGRSEHARDRYRSIALSQLAPLVAPLVAPLAAVTGEAASPDIVFISLQKGSAGGQAASPPPGMHLLDFTDELNDLSDTAALISQLDLVITVDTSLCHLAGALGKPVWTMIPHIPDWRWMLEREDSPWYPTMRLFRQSRFREWGTVAQRIAGELRMAAGKLDRPRA